MRNDSLHIMDDVKLLQTRVPEEDFETVQKLSHAAGLSPAAWVRRVILRETRDGGAGGLVEEIDRQIRYAPDGCFRVMTKVRDYLKRVL